MTRRLLILAACLSCLPGLARAQLALSPLDDHALADQRGGIQTPLGLDIGFGATVRTYVDGQLALESKLMWTDGGAAVEHPEGVSIPGVTTITGGPTAGTPLSLPPGMTAVMHDLTSGRIGSVVVNTASNRTIRQTTDIVLTLPQLPQLQQQMARDRIVSQLQSSVGAALSTQAGR
jgi:hypothetical protein